MRAARVREEIRKAGIPDVKHVWFHEFGSRFFLAVSIKQRYAGHAAQVGHVATMCQGAAYMGRYVVVVDDDIDVYDTMDVMWAMATRSDPVRDINIIPRAWSDELDPMVAQGNAEAPFNSRAIIDATWPWEWRGKIPTVISLSPEDRAAALEKWGHPVRPFAKPVKGPLGTGLQGGAASGTSEGREGSGSDERPAPYDWYVLIVLTVIFLLASVDRSLVSVVMEPIRHESG
ncbi:hypothetical protein ACFSTI_21765 [Rhizorhabdus histidinilytica]